MTHCLIVRPEAEGDIADVYRWYEEKRPGLGADFLLCVEDGLAKIQRHPEMYPFVYRNLRRILIRRFPYGVFFLEGRTGVVVCHAHRDPRTWQSRR